jgi:hypothetical protein
MHHRPKGNHPHLADMPLIVRHQDRGALRLDHRHDQALCRRRAVIWSLITGIMPRTGSSWIAVALASSSVMHAARAGRERESGQDAWMPPRLEEGLRDDRVPGDPGRSRAEGRTPARDHPADLDAGRRPGPRNVAAGLAGAVQAGGPQEGTTARHVPALSAVTLSHAEGHGERAHCRR